MILEKNNLADAIVKMKVEDYRKDIEKSSIGISRRFYSSDYGMTTDREKKNYPMNLIEVTKKINKLNNKRLDATWEEMSEGCYPASELFSVNIGIPGIQDSPAVREAIFNHDITEASLLRKISIGGMAALDSLSYNYPNNSNVKNIYKELALKAKEKVKTIYIVKKRPEPNMAEMKNKFKFKNNSDSIFWVGEVPHMDTSELPEEFLNSSFFQELKTVNPLRREKAKKRVRNTRSTRRD